MSETPDTPTLGAGWRIDPELASNGNYQLCGPGGFRAYLPSTLAPAIPALNAALSTPADLPDGVVYDEREGAPSSLILHAKYPLPEGWEWWDTEGWRTDDIGRWKVARYVRRSQKPRTEPVPLHELTGRVLPGCDWKVKHFISPTDGTPRFRAVHDEMFAYFDVNADGMVDVLTEDER